MMEIAFQILGWLVYFACFVAIIAFAIFGVGDMSPLGGWLVGLIGAPLWIMLGLLVYDQAYGYHPTFSLRTEDWECKAWAVSHETYYVQVGKVMVPQTNEVKTCTQYNAKG